jgi:hypothetical protein
MASREPAVLVANEECLAVYVQRAYPLRSLTSCSAIANQQNSPLLRLPSEIRNGFCDLIFETSSDDRHHRSVDHIDWDRLEFARVCRLLWAEYATAYFRSKILPFRAQLSFSTWKELAAYPTRITLQQRLAIRCVAWPINIYDGDASREMHKLSLMPGLKKVVLPDGSLDPFLKTNSRYMKQISGNAELEVVFEP